MSSELFNQAQAELRLVDVFMREAKVQASDSFDPRSVPPGDQLDSQYRHLVIGLERLTPADGDVDAETFFRVVIELAIRWGKQLEPAGEDSIQAADTDDEISENFNELGRIEAQYVAEYVQKADLTMDCLHAFAFRAPSVHVWPYWREFVASTCARLNVPKIVVPPMQRPQNPEDDLKSGVTEETTSRVLFAGGAQSTATPAPDRKKEKK